MAPRISICRKGDNSFLAIEGDYSCESFEELFSVVRQLLTTSLKCVVPGSQVTYSIKTRCKVDLKKMGNFRQLLNEQPCCLDACADGLEGKERGVVAPPEESPRHQVRNGLTLIKGGAL